MNEEGSKALMKIQVIILGGCVSREELMCASVVGKRGQHEIKLEAGVILWRGNIGAITS